MLDGGEPAAVLQLRALHDVLGAADRGDQEAAPLPFIVKLPFPVAEEELDQDLLRGIVCFSPGKDSFLLADEQAESKQASRPADS